MNKKNLIMWVISLTVAVALLIIISKLIFSGINKLNQGQFRVTDAIVTSTATVEDVSNDKAKWEINISQKNRLSLLIQGMDEAKISKVEIDNMKIINKPKVGALYISEPRTKEVKDIQSNNDSVAIYVDKKPDGSNMIEIDILNKDIIKNFVIAEGVKEIRHDGTAIGLVGKTISDISFKVSFNLNITATNGKKCSSKITLNLPDKTLITNGQVVTRLPLNEFNFRV